jgi:hypothetical protein
MKTLFFTICIGAAIAYFGYVLYWRINAVSEGVIKKDHEKAIAKSGRSTDWISWVLLSVAILFGLLCLQYV